MIQLCPLIALTLAERGANTLKNLFKFHTEEKPTDENIMRLILPSVLGIIFCMVCLCGTTWAWFSGVMASGTATVQAANYAVSATVTEGDSAAVRPGANDTFVLDAGKIYTVELKVEGTAQKTAGYCKVTYQDETYYTDSMKQGDQMKFQVSAGDGGTLTVLGLWGTYSGSADLKADGSSTIVGKTRTTQTVQDDDPALEDTTDPAETTADTKEADTTNAEEEEVSASVEETTAQTPEDTTVATEETTGVQEEATQEETSGVQ